MITSWEKKGNYIRKFLTEPEYLPILQKQEKHLIKIKRQAIVQKRKLAIYPSPGQAGPPPGEGSFITGWEGTVVFLWR
ncbi:MAG: DUF5720 family protein [Oscillospiraceae bacterium]